MRQPAGARGRRLLGGLVVAALAPIGLCLGAAVAQGSALLLPGVAWGLPTATSSPSASSTPANTVTASPLFGADEDRYTAWGTSYCGEMFVGLNYQRYDGIRDNGGAQVHASPIPNDPRYVYRTPLPVPADADPRGPAWVTAEPVCNYEPEYRDAPASPVPFDVRVARTVVLTGPEQVHPGGAVAVTVRRCYGATDWQHASAQTELTVTDPSGSHSVLGTIRQATLHATYHVPAGSGFGAGTVGLADPGVCPGSQVAPGRFQVVGYAPVAASGSAGPAGSKRPSGGGIATAAPSLTAAATPGGAGSLSATPVVSLPRPAGSGGRSLRWLFWLAAAVLAAGAAATWPLLARRRRPRRAD